MPRHKEAPWGFKCPYEHHCPHLQGLSTYWMFNEYQRAHTREHEQWLSREKMSKEISGLLRSLREVEDERDELRAENKQLHQKQFKTNRPKQPVSGDENPVANPSEVPKKKRGAPMGHPAWNRKKPESIDRTIEVDAPCVCPTCQAQTDLSQTQTSSYIQEDIILCSKTVVTEFIHTSAWCPTCRKQVGRTLENEIPNAPIGPNAKIAALFMRHELRLSYRQVSRAMSTLFGLDFVPASTLGFEEKARANAVPVYEDLIAKVQASDLVHADETHWRQDGQSAYIWYAGNPDLAVFHADRSRSSAAAKVILGDKIDGLLVADAYAGYNAIEVKGRQSCLAHLIRTASDIKDVLESKKYPDHESISLCRKLGTVFTLACRIALPPDKSSRQQLKQRYIHLLDSICSTSVNSSKAETFRKRFLPGAREYNEVFAFIDFEGPPTNNHAERALRPLVLFRKTSMGTRSETGSENITLFASLLQTAKLQEASIITLLKALLSGTPGTTQAAVFGKPNSPKNS